MIRVRVLVFAAAIAATVSAALPGRTEIMAADYAAHRILEGTILSNGIRVTFTGYVASGAWASSSSGAPEGAPYVDQMWAEVTVRKGTAVREVDAPFTITVDPALATGRITGSFEGVGINISLTGTGTPATQTRPPGVDEVEPPGLIATRGSVEVRRPATVTGSASATGVGSITGGTGTGELGSGAGGFIFYWDVRRPAARA